jgi:predicted RNA-binding Zn-ribbon protein involved in translation (DUF1610 family)
MAGDLNNMPLTNNPTAPKPYVKNFDCPNCGASIAIRCVGSSINAVCQQCGSIIDTSRSDYKVIDQFNQATLQMLIPLGTRGILKGIEWEMIGYTQRYDEQYLFTWQEYLLFNPRYGFRFLVESDRHWSLVQLLRTQIKDKSSSLFGQHEQIEFDGKKYKLYHRGRGNVSSVVGEFYWRVKVNDQVQYADYICPPFSLTKEFNLEETVWSQGEYLTREEVQEAFKLKLDLPKASSNGQLQPNPFQQKILPVSLLAVLFFSMLIVIGILSGILSPTKEVFRHDYLLNQQSMGKEWTSESFTIGSFRNSVDVNISANLDNNWTELEFELVNDVTGETAYGTKTIEYYHGVDSDGSWYEGSNNANVTIPSVENGLYHLVFTPTMAVQPEGSTRPVKDLGISIRTVANAPNYANFWLSAFLLGIYPLWLFCRSYSFEASRWQDSDYSPYSSGDDGDDGDGGGDD